MWRWTMLPKVPPKNMIFCCIGLILPTIVMMIFLNQEWAICDTCNQITEFYKYESSDGINIVAESTTTRKEHQIWPVEDETGLSYSNAFVLEDSKFLLVSVATEENSAARRFRRSAWVNRMPLKILGLGLGLHWGGNGQKVKLLKEELKKYKNDTDKIVMFADSHDVLINDNVESITKKFKSLDANIVFSAERNCWPAKSLASKHPPVENGYRYLNSGLFIGYAPHVYQMVSHEPFPADGHDQDYYMRIFVNSTLREKMKIKLDNRADLFQSLYNLSKEIELKFYGKLSYLHNKIYNTRPSCIHGNGRITKEFIDTIGNYIPLVWNPEDGCTACLDDTIDTRELNDEQLPTILVGIFFKDTVAHSDTVFESLTKLDYPKTKIHLFIFNGDLSKKLYVDTVCSNFRVTYSSVTCFHGNDTMTEVRARNEGVSKCHRIKCDYFFVLDGSVSLTHRDTLKLLIEQNRPVIVPMLFRNKDPSYVNFLGALVPDFYPPSIDILKNNRRGLWKVPLARNCYMIRGDVIINSNTRPEFAAKNETSPDAMDSDVNFSADMRSKDVDLFVSNRFDFGHLLEVL